ncbi:MAG: cell envelope integrity EipB family protein [Rhizobiales bacterium]|nr:cell envelope integrity EipB family protein [Hyphomicrobiales bacterium]MBN9010602.1 cell envelope integrity EipB family protein [Hyphomicrobiales bacterium]
MIRVTALAVVIAGLGLGAAHAAPVGLAAHRAIYDLSLATAKPDSPMGDVTGRMVMEFTGSACSGYSTKLRFVTRTEDPDGGDQVTDSRSTMFEAADGKSLDFTNETYTDDALAEESRGSAKRKEKNVAVALTKPSDKTFDLAPSVVFPTEQMMKVIDAARAGQRFLSFDVYDGSEDGETVFATAGVIGAEMRDEDGGSEKVVKDAGIAGMRHWPVTISYFEKKNGIDETPFYVMSFVVYENGIGRSLKIDYGDFSLSGQLTKLDILPEAPCPAPKR